MNAETTNVTRLTRRAFLRRGALLLAAGSAAPGAAAPEKPVLKIALFTDVHYADKAAAGTRHYRQSPEKLRRSVDRFNEARAALAVELGDFIDEAASVEDEIGYLKRIDREYARFKGERHYALGNHCVWSLTKEEFFAHSGARKGYYSFDRGGFHFVVLDACFRADGTAYGRKNFNWTDTEIPAAERRWLEQDLEKTSSRTIVFLHQRLDVAGHYGVKSGPEVRKILETSGRVLAVFQGHYHLNDHREIGGIHYTTLRAMVEGPDAEKGACGLLEVYRDGSLKVDGFHSQRDYSWGSSRP
jgi:alkaline phosphatase